MQCHANFLCRGMEGECQRLHNQHTSEVLIPRKGQDHRRTEASPIWAKWGSYLHATQGSTSVIVQLTHTHIVEVEVEVEVVYHSERFEIV